MVVSPGQSRIRSAEELRRAVGVFAFGLVSMLSEALEIDSEELREKRQQLARLVLGDLEARAQKDLLEKLQEEIDRLEARG